MAVDHVEVSLPEWLYAGDTKSFMRAIGWDAVATSDSSKWQVALEEKVASGRSMLTLSEILAPDDPVDIAEHPILLEAATRTIARSTDFLSRIETEISRIGPIGDISSLQDLTRMIYISDLTMLISAGPAFGDVTNELMNRIRKEFPRSALYFIRVDSALSLRTTILRVLMRMENEPSTFKIPPLAGSGGLAFEGGIDLTDDLAMGLRAFLDPLLLSLSPFAWGHRHLCDAGVLVVSFGTAVAIRSGEPNEPLNFFGRGAETSTTAPPPVSAEAIHSALAWWVEKLSSLLSSATDPCQFDAGDGSYDVARHQEALFTLNQAFRAIQSISIQHRDGFARQTLLFSALDSLESLYKVKLDNLVEAPFAERVLDNLRKQLPKESLPVLLPRAEGAVDALKEMRNSFGSGGRVSGSGVRVPNSDRGNGETAERTLNFDRAVAQYLRVRRNATHGFGGRKHKYEIRDRILLSSHSGRVPPKVADLSYLYGLNLLATGQETKKTS